MTNRPAPSTGPRALLLRLRGRPDSEHEMSFNRVAFALIGLGTTIVAKLDPHIISVLVGFCAISILVFVHLLVDGSARVWRRVLMMVVDLAMICFYMRVNDAYGAGFWPLLLWTILGNGFRFGNAYLLASAGIAIGGFGLVVATTAFWRDHLPLSVGLLLGLVALPAYAGTLIRKLSSATAAAEEASRAKSYFLASVSHELRTPLTAIIGLGAHLNADVTEPERRQMADTIVGAGRTLLGMINRLLDYSRIEARGAVAETVPFDLARLLIGVRELMRVETAEKGLSLNIHLAAETPLRLRGDEAHLRDILVNLVGNAIKFTEAGAITLIGDTRRDDAGRLMLHLTVADTGIGIAEEAQERIFSSFHQADDTIIDRYGGTGLGLAICRQLARLMGGEIGVTSRPGAGSRFWFSARVEEDNAPGTARGEVRRLLFSDDPSLEASTGDTVLRRETRAAIRELCDPAHTTVVLADARTVRASGRTPFDLEEILGPGAVAVLLTDPGVPELAGERIERSFATAVPRDADPAAIDRAVAVARALAGDSGERAEEEAPPAARTPRRVLVADDNRMNQKVFAMVLGRAGHDVVLADDGEAALDLMKDHRFDVVLMDVNMPALNGVEATKLYRFAALGQRRIPIVGVTADTSPATAERCIEAGMEACVAKPIEATPLLDLIDRLTSDLAVPAAPAPLAFDPSGVVTPLFRGDDEAEPAIEWNALAELEELGGRDFVVDLIGVYLRDSADVLAEIGASVADGDVAAFRSRAHALRSSAANIGATRLAALCLHYQRIGEAEFHERASRHLTALADELERVAQALTQRPEWRPAASG